MANQDELAILKEGVDVWNQWIKQQSVDAGWNGPSEDQNTEARWNGPSDELSTEVRWNEFRESLDGIEVLTFERVSEIEMQQRLASNPGNSQRQATRRGFTTVPDFYEADLSSADLMAARLQGIDLVLADLSKANLIRADLSGALLINAKLNGADLWRASLISAHLEGAQLNEARLLAATLRAANLGKAHLRSANLRETDLRGAILWDTDLSSADLRKSHLEEAILWNAKLRNADLSGAYLQKADLRGADLRGANLSDAHLEDANLWQVDLTGADLRGAYCAGTNLTEANLSQADLRKASLARASLIGTIIDQAKISGSSVYAVSVWDLKGEFAEQKDMVITPENAPVITVDNIRVAQFIYLILNNAEIRDVINTLTSKSVLILGRFALPERKLVLDTLRNKLREYDLLPIVFDFDRPTDKDFTETIKTLAGLSYFVIADVTNPKSSPLELQATVPDYQVPFVPIIQEGERPFAMMVDLQKKYDWVLKTRSYDSIETLMKILKPLIIDAAMEKHNELRRIKAAEPEIISGKDYVEKEKE